ncbi:hypothetical protein PR048_006097 [Dryococelus australis]|uniref:C2H2-type domain-containing protein n=1 Tax=Dryococelus australis TaxID=614101 RepID=A0ABQ9IB37_9NEOP|nr:hypothetical protein PR048_006097 [Dryococelus australis]
MMRASEERMAKKRIGYYRVDVLERDTRTNEPSFCDLLPSPITNYHILRLPPAQAAKRCAKLWLMKLKSGPTPSTSNRRWCRYCERVYAFDDNARRHEKSEYLKNLSHVIFSCDDCPRQFARIDNLNSHAKVCNGDVLDVSTLFPTGFAGKSGVKKVKDDKNCNYVFPEDPNELVNRLTNSIALQQGGDFSRIKDISSIIGLPHHTFFSPSVPQLPSRLPPQRIPLAALECFSFSPPRYPEALVTRKKPVPREERELHARSGSMRSDPPRSSPPPGRPARCPAAHLAPGGMIDSGCLAGVTASLNPRCGEVD